MSIVYYNEPSDNFSELYLKVRKKEVRLYTDEQVKQLPELHKNHFHYKEWQLRKSTAVRFVSYLKSKNKTLNILEVGCGNGWFSHLLSTIKNTEVVGVDINETELQQASKVFKKNNLSFAYADLYKKSALHSQKFDIIVLNSCLQYFETAASLIQIAVKLLTPEGELHILDTPFYKNNEIEQAKQRTQSYYEQIGFSEMTTHYFHHRFEDLGNHKIMYQPVGSFLNYFKKDSPFYWILIQNH